MSVGASIAIVALGKVIGFGNLLILLVIIALLKWLIDGGFDVIHGHSSHHPRPVEVYRGRLVLYGCGDAINDYEGISGYGQFRGDLRLLYVASVTGRIAPTIDRALGDMKGTLK